MNLSDQKTMIITSEYPTITLLYERTMKTKIIQFTVTYMCFTVYNITGRVNLYTTTCTCNL